MREVYSTQLAIAVGLLIFMAAAIFALLQSPEMLSVPERTSLSLPHPVEGHERCDACHGHKGVRPYPTTHLGWDNRSCMRCHLPVLKSSAAASPGTPEDMTRRAPLNPHPVKGWDDCMACHAVVRGGRPAPQDHEGRTNDGCHVCHRREGIPS